jgi:hypothetical protein
MLTRVGTAHGENSQSTRGRPGESGGVALSNLTGNDRRARSNAEVPSQCSVSLTADICVSREGGNLADDSSPEVDRAYILH